MMYNETNHRVDKDWLLIYDDVYEWNKRTSILWPSTCKSRGAVLFTSQVANTVDPWIHDSIIVPPFNLDNGSAFLQWLVRESSESAAMKISAFLGGHPESLISAARFCRRLGLSLDECSKQLAPKALEGWWKAADELRSSRLSTFLKQNQLDWQARRLLHVLCMFNHEYIPEETFQDEGIRPYGGIDNKKLG
jgi:hypothetical protein